MAVTACNGEPSSETPNPASSSTSYVRLHVTPLDDQLLKVVLSSALQPKARNISYHTLDTFPDKRYGFLELPDEDADKLRKKLNGAVLKGVKIRIERARPSRIPAPLAEEAMAKDKTAKRAADGKSHSKAKDKSKKRRRDTAELDGIVLENDRKIKRGWTGVDEPKAKRSKKDKESKDKKKKQQVKSKYTDHAECLVKTVLPANATPTTEAGTPPSAKHKGRPREITVHEFERTTKFPTFLKTTSSVDRKKVSLEYIDGTGWVDESGNVVEAVRTRPVSSGKVLLSKKKEAQSTEDAVDGDGSSSSSDDEAAGNSDLDSDASASRPERSPAPVASSPVSPQHLASPRPRSSGSAKNLSIRIPPTTPNAPKVHPLEALYKLPKHDGEAVPDAASDEQGFSFFANGDDQDAEEEGTSEPGDASGIQVPLTPFTRRDLESRGIRSAAPTPDTAHPNRRFTPWEPEGHGSEDDDGEESADEHVESDAEVPSNQAASSGKGDGEQPTSDFQTWFWEHRGDLNRSWKKRRKLAGKDKRYRENKARMARAI